MGTRMTLLTGATGYIGRLLLRRFEAAGRPLHCLVRDPRRLGPVAATTSVVRGDCLDEPSLDRALTGVDTAYYLVHSMGAGARFAEIDRQAAERFGRAASRAGVRRIVYLGGLTGDDGVLSEHLKSRAETGERLRAAGVPVIEFRASIIIGAGSLSFEMIRALVERLPVMVCPRWVSTRAQPIGINDVLRYLEDAADLPDRTHGVFEIGGPEVLSYGDMMREYARRRGLRRLLVPVPLLTPRLSGLWLSLVTPAHARVGRALVEGLRNSTIVRSPTARQHFPFEPQPFGVVLQQAIDDGIESRLFRDTRTIDIDAPSAAAFAPVRRIGGGAGWYFGNLLWQIRGALDGLVGGAGLRRGRRDAEHCQAGDTIDGWTVESYEPDRRLRLAADMKLPGRGWLEFEVIALDADRSRLRQTATFDPRGLLGHAYWYGILPLHALMFNGLIRQIARRATAGARL